MLTLPTPLSSSRFSSSRSLAAPSGSSASSSPSYSHRTRKLGTRPARRQHTNLIHRLLPLYVQKCQRCQIFQLVLFLTNNLFTNLISVYQICRSVGTIKKCNPLYGMYKTVVGYILNMIIQQINFRDPPSGTGTFL